MTILPTLTLTLTFPLHDLHFLALALLFTPILTITTLFFTVLASLHSILGVSVLTINIHLALLTALLLVASTPSADFRRWRVLIQSCLLSLREVRFRLST